MSLTKSSMSTREFAEKAGVSRSTVSKWLRSGRIEGKKKSGKWVISTAELTKIGHPPTTHSASAPEQPAATESSPSKIQGTVFTIEQFSAMTYLTPFGVQKWLKEGRLAGAVDSSGNPGVDAANLDNPLIKRLIR